MNDKSIKYMSVREQGILNSIITVIRRELNPAKIILFGSRAKGNFSKNADFDIAVDRERIDITRHREIMEQIDEIRGLYKVDIVYLKSVDEDFMDIILKTGKTIYARRD